MSRAAPRVVAGVDGARRAWVVGYLPLDPQARGWLECHDTFASVRRAVDAAHAEAVGIDMPIGLATGAQRASDAAARARLAGRRSTLFPTPAAAVLHAASHAEAVRVNRDAVGVGISIQAWNLVPQIREVRAAIAPGECDRFVECHPETSFVAMAGRALAPKRSAAGVGQRLAALRPEVAELDELLSAAPQACAIDDVLDALAAAWSARRLALGVAEHLGDEVTDVDGYPQTIIV